LPICKMPKGKAFCYCSCSAGRAKPKKTAGISRGFYFRVSVSRNLASMQLLASALRCCSVSFYQSESAK